MSFFFFVSFVLPPGQRPSGPAAFVVKRLFQDAQTVRLTDISVLYIMNRSVAPCVPAP